MGTDYGTVQVRNPMGPGGHLQAGCGAPLLWEEQQGWPGSVPVHKISSGDES